ncbi:MAG: hypothetical protein LBU89_13415 [Fibromonadaceae bacterium]|jgi:hypothetical protein|nr:hypothetical protein [Fibromonadaceae bacterium]
MPWWVNLNEYAFTGPSTLPRDTWLTNVQITTVPWQREFATAYNEAWNSAKTENNKSVPKHLEGGTAIDTYA